MRNHWYKELYRLAWLLGGCLLLGLVIGETEYLLLAGLAAYIAWVLWQLKRIHDWLYFREHEDPPEGIGLWGYICDQIYRLHRQQREAREQLQADVEYLRASFTSLSDAVVMINRRGGIDWCNAAAVRFLGLRLPADQRQPVVNLLRDPAFIAYFEAGDFSEPVVMAAPNDSNRSLLVQITRFGQGNYLLFARDISELLKLEQMRKDFVSNVSHELRTPLTVLAGYLDNFSLLAENNPAMQKPLTQMAKNVQRMETLLRDLLELARLETQSNETHKTRVSLSDLAHTLADEARASLPSDEQRDIQLDVQPGIEIFGHPTELHSALSNLIINACKYTRNHGQITIRCYQDGQGVHIAVRDNGIGIDPAEIPRLTERFYRADNSRSSSTGGTGLGLSIVKHILQRHEAELAIESAPGKGSCFCCHFPLHRAVRLDKANALFQKHQ